MSLNTQAVGGALMSSSHTHFYGHAPLPLPVPKIPFLSSQEGELRFHPLTEDAAQGCYSGAGTVRMWHVG